MNGTSSRLRCPVVIMDEAHNARTQLSFDTLARFWPSCVIEFTATPETEHDPRRGRFASNVLYHVSAAELKADQMLKLPIKLQTRSDWRETIGGAVQARRGLERLAQEEAKETGEYLRPIVLLQAQPHSKERETLTVEAVKRSLLEDFKVPETQIAVATGQTREIDYGCQAALGHRSGGPYRPCRTERREQGSDTAVRMGRRLSASSTGR